MTGEVIEMARKEMEKAVEAFKHELARVRTGRASTALIENIQVNYYGAKTPLRQLAGLAAPEARLLVITPYDKSSLHDIEKAIQRSVQPGLPRGVRREADVPEALSRA